MQDVLTTLIVFSVPLSAILGSVYLKTKRLEAERGKSAPVELRTLEGRLASLERERDELRGRVETLETIVTDADPARLQGIRGARALEGASTDANQSTSAEILREANASPAVRRS